MKYYHRVMKNYRLKDKRERNKKVWGYYQQGYTMRAIAGIFHISHVMVCKIIKRERERDEG